MSVVVPVRPVATYVAVMIVVPVVVPAVASPCDPVSLLISAIAVLDEAQDTNSVMTFGGMLEVAPVNKAIAVNCVEDPVLMITLVGIISSEVTTLTVTLQVIDGWAISVAVITAVPSLTAVTRPVSSTVATSGADDCHVTWVQNATNFPSDK